MQLCRLLLTINRRRVLYLILGIIPFLIVNCMSGDTHVNDTPSASYLYVKDAQQVIEKLKAVGISIDDTLPLDKGDQTLKHYYKDERVFHILGSGKVFLGMITICNTTTDCKNLYDGFEISKKAGIIDVSQSDDGLIVCTFDVGVSEEVKSKIKQVISTLRAS